MSTPKDLLQLDSLFIQDNTSELLELIDYIPFSFVEYDLQNERDEFLRSKNLLSTIQEMDQLITAKCENYEDPVKAYNSVLVEWLACHPKFEGIISNESVSDYQNMKKNKKYVDFIDLCYENKVWEPPKKSTSLRDDSSIQLPNFKKIDEFYEKYGYSLLTYYLAYIVN